MNNSLNSLNPNALRMRRMRENNTPEEREERLARDRQRKRQKLAVETVDEHETRLARIRDRYSYKTPAQNTSIIHEKNTSKDANNCLNDQNQNATQVNKIQYAKSLLYMAPVEKLSTLDR
ncbi:16715_t:CDS:1, partial [Acaulospora morrowiae]